MSIFNKQSKDVTKTYPSESIRNKMNEDMEIKNLYNTYRRAICAIMESKRKGMPIIDFVNLFRNFETPQVLDAFTAEQLELISQMKEELYELGKLFGYFDGVKLPDSER